VSVKVVIKGPVTVASDFASAVSIATQGDAELAMTGAIYTGTSRFGDIAWVSAGGDIAETFGAVDVAGYSGSPLIYLNAGGAIDANSGAMTAAGAYNAKLALVMARKASTYTSMAC
jgi:hypothetical protein